MDQEQAAEVKRHLLSAARALDQASGAIFRAGKADAERFEEMLVDVYHTLYSKLLPALYREHPELKPPPEPPRVSSTLRWDEVSLPTGITAVDIDAVIFELLKPRRQKMAKLVGAVSMRFEAQSIPISPEIVAARIIALEESGRIEGAGDLRMWGHSEVRLP